MLKKRSIKKPLKINNYGIPEPVSDKVLSPDMLLIPLVAFDQNYASTIGYNIRQIDLLMMGIVLAVTVIGLKLVGLILIVVFPQIALWLPAYLYGQ